MSAIDFPASPTNNQEFNGYRYSSAKGAWLKIKDPITITYVGDSAPASPFDGQIWFNTALGITSIYYDDGNTSQWIEIVEAGGQGPTGPTGSLVMDISSSSPSGPTAGQIWYDADDGKIYFYYVDEDSGQWVEIGSPRGPSLTDGELFRENPQQVSSSYIIPVGRNATTTGKIQINSSVLVTVSNGSVWAIV